MQLFGLPWSTLLPLFGGMAVATAMASLTRSLLSPPCRLLDARTDDRHGSRGIGFRGCSEKRVCRRVGVTGPGRGGRVVADRCFRIAACPGSAATFGPACAAAR